jgi:hypothetical protein
MYRVTLSHKGVVPLHPLPDLSCDRVVAHDACGAFFHQALLGCANLLRLFLSPNRLKGLYPLYPSTFTPFTRLTGPRRPKLKSNGDSTQRGPQSLLQGRGDQRSPGSVHHVWSQRTVDAVDAVQLKPEAAVNIIRIIRVDISSRR